MALFANPGIAGYASTGNISGARRNEWEQLRLVYNMSSYRRIRVRGEAVCMIMQLSLYLKSLKSVKDPDYGLRIRCRKESELRHVISIYNRLHPREKNQCGRVPQVLWPTGRSAVARKLCWAVKRSTARPLVLPKKQT